ncbi:Hypothetical protein I5071_56030 [Sandaracinus amylolyticus]|nr:Hypothetical protein I5071_56030 [Sandaracinus amylolyticus]
MMENRSFDHMLGWVPGADGIQNGATYRDVNGDAIPAYRLSPDYQGCGLDDPPHGYEDGRACVNGGAMDGFLHAAAVGDIFPVGYYTAEDLPFYAACAEHFTICDRYHTGILSSTQPNRMYMHCGQTDRITTGSTIRFSELPTVWDAADAAGVSSRYYFSNLPYTALWGAKHLRRSRNISAFEQDAAAGTLASISYVDPFFYQGGRDDVCNDDHPFADVRNGQRFLKRIYDALRASPQWDRTLLVINYDEWGGFFDHVVPPFMPVSDEERDVVGNDGQLGIRVPCVLIGPRVKRGHVESTLFEPNSILKFMEWRWGLAPLGVRSAVTNNLALALDFDSAPRVDAPEIEVPPNDPETRICEDEVAPAMMAAKPESAMSDSMAAHAREVLALQALARSHGFTW